MNGSVRYALWIPLCLQQEARHAKNGVAARPNAEGRRTRMSSNADTCPQMWTPLRLESELKGDIEKIVPGGPLIPKPDQP
jgi:hypothetical protein